MLVWYWNGDIRDAEFYLSMLSDAIAAYEQEIESLKWCIESRLYDPSAPETIKVFRDPRITVRYMPSEYESQLCDCPYWGTEFS